MKAGSREKPEQFVVVDDHTFRVDFIRKDKLTIPGLAVVVPAGAPTASAGRIGTVMLVAWAGMGVGGYAGGLLFDVFASYALSFALAGAAGALNLIAILVLAGLRRRAGSPAAT